jgi:hypothetical protein
MDSGVVVLSLVALVDRPGNTFLFLSKGVLEFIFCPLLHSQINFFRTYLDTDVYMNCVLAYVDMFKSVYIDMHMYAYFFNLCLLSAFSR